MATLLANQKLRTYAREKGVMLWQLSEALGYPHDTRLSKELRHELSPVKLREYQNIIDRLSLKE